MKDKKGKTVLNVFIEIAKESNLKPNNLWVDQGREFYNKLMQEWLDYNYVLMYSTHSKGKSVIVERFRKILTSKIYKKMIANDSKSCFPFLNKLAGQCNNTFHHSINKKPINADYYALSEKIETDPEASKIKVNDRVRISKYKNFFSKVYTENWSKEIFIFDFLLKTNPFTHKIKDLN